MRNPKLWGRTVALLNQSASMLVFVSGQFGFSPLILDKMQIVLRGRNLKHCRCSWNHVKGLKIFEDSACRTCSQTAISQAKGLKPGEASPLMLNRGRQDNVAKCRKMSRPLPCKFTLTKCKLDRLNVDKCVHMRKEDQAL